MSFIELQGIEDAKEQKAAPEGPYDLVITSAKMHEKDDKQSIALVLNIEGNDDYAAIFHYVALPGANDDDDKKSAKLLFAKRFFTQFGIALDGGVELEQIVGSRATGANLVQEEYNGQLNNKLQVARLPNEEE